MSTRRATLSPAAGLAVTARMDHACRMPIEPPDPLNIAKRLRDLRERTKAVREDIATLIAANTANQAAVNAHGSASDAMAALDAAADSLDPPR